MFNLANFFSIKWWKIYLVVSTLFLLFTWLYYHTPEFLLKWLLVMPFALTFENNVAAWWSGISLLSASLLSYELFSTTQQKFQLSWLLLSFLFLAFFMDELGSMHERVGGWSEVAPFGVIFFLMLIIALYNLLRSVETKKSGKLIALGCFMFILTAVQEKIEHSVNWPYQLLGLRAVVEEGTELFGIFLLLCGFAEQKAKSCSARTIEIVVSKPMRMFKFDIILFLGVIAHCVTVFLLIADDGRGRPERLFPAFCYFILFSGFLWNYLDAKSAFRGRWLVLSSLSLLFSMTSIFKMEWAWLPLLPGEVISQVPVLIGVQAFAFVAVSWKMLPATISKAKIFYIIGLSLFVFICAFCGGSMGLLAFGIFPYIIFLLFFSQPSSSGFSHNLSENFG